MNIHFIKSPEKRKIVEDLNERFGIDELPYLLIESGKERIRGFSGSLNKDEILELSRLLNVESIGLYIIRREHNLRLSFDATQVLAKKITKSIVNIEDENYNHWIRGHDLDIKAEQGIVVIKHKGDNIGCGISTGEKIINHVPKERRIKTKLPQIEN